jgi:Tfp pilus assembly protein PilW
VDNTGMISLVVLAVLVVLYIVKRRARLNREDL